MSRTDTLDSNSVLAEKAIKKNRDHVMSVLQPVSVLHTYHMNTIAPWEVQVVSEEGETDLAAKERVLNKLADQVRVLTAVVHK